MVEKEAFYQELANIVRYHRKKSGLNQAELARLAGVGKTVVFDLEHGKKTIQFNTLLSILAALNIQCELTSPLMSVYQEEQHASR